MGTNTKHCSQNLSKLLFKMGQTGSRVANKIANSFSFSETPSDEYMVEVANTAAVAGFKGTPFVFTRRGSQFFDEDGDLAHEFYEEVPVDNTSAQEEDEEDVEQSKKDVIKGGRDGGKTTTASSSSSS